MTLVAIGGKKMIKGGNNIARGTTELLGFTDKLKAGNILHVSEENARYSYYFSIL